MGHPDTGNAILVSMGLRQAWDLLLRYYCFILKKFWWTGLLNLNLPSPNSYECMYTAKLVAAHMVVDVFVSNNKIKHIIMEKCIYRIQSASCTTKLQLTQILSAWTRKQIQSNNLSPYEKVRNQKGDCTEPFHLQRSHTYIQEAHNNLWSTLICITQNIWFPRHFRKKDW